MKTERDVQPTRAIPYVTYTLIALNIFIYLWDRGGGLTGPSVAFADLALRPTEIVRAAKGTGYLPALGTLFTSMFLHGNLLHILSNLIFLGVFGQEIEEAFGSFKFVLLYLFWGIFACLAHVLVLPHSSVPLLGASGAIGGILGCYFLLYPGNVITVNLLILLTFDVAAWILLGLWFLYQILVPQDGVANWAHVGGFLAGMLSVLILGGKQRILQHLEPRPAGVYD